MRKLTIISASLVVGIILPQLAAAEEENKQAAIVGAELSAIANQLSLRPKSAIDFSKVSGEYCFFTGWDAHHTHYAIDPTGTQEDAIDFVDARPLLEAGVKPEGLPAMPDKLRKMTPKQWYFLAAGKHDPHHNAQYEFPVLLRASNLE